MGNNGDEPGFEPLARGASIGRYLVLNLLGRGGMGEVYAAFDPELDRKVAVKLLRARIENGVSMSEGRQRTLREAQAIARLAHPNVVVVFDVGTFREQVFIAMEFVDGHTASYWVQSQPRTWQEILKVYLAAGRGLEAAHEKGLVHRDFKPENVMVARDGEVRVMDFGLAREIEGRATVNGPVTTTTGKFDGVRTDGGTIVLHKQRAEVASAADGPRRTVGAVPVALANEDGIVREMRDTDPSVAADLFSARLTRTGAIMGTPAYMAPEQFFKAGTDARSDQFSFCVTLYEALYGERPFPGNNIQTLVGNIVQGNIRDPPPGSKVPSWVRKILLRGLRPTAADRYPSMGEILEALKTNPRAKYRRIAVGVALAMVPIAVGFGFRQLAADPSIVCTNGADRLAEAWELTADNAPEAPRQRRIHDAFLSTGKTYAADVYDTVRRTLSDYVRSWSSMYKETCEATHVRHEQSPDVLDLRMSCLSENLKGLRALTQVFEGADNEVVENAVSATSALATNERCNDITTLRAVVAPPEDKATRGRVDEFRQALADLKAQFDAGHWKAALQQTEPLLTRIRSLNYRPLTAEALYLAGLMYTRADDAAAAERVSTEAYLLADACRDDEVRAEAATNLVFIVGDLEGRLKDALTWFDAASAVVQRLGGHEILRAWLSNNIGCAMGPHNGDAAIKSLQEAIRLKERILGSDNVDVAWSQNNLAIVFLRMQRYSDALVQVERAIAIFRLKLGNNHPEAAAELSTRGEALNGLGRFREARESFEQARQICQHELGADAVEVADALMGIGVSYLGESNPDKARPALERALDIRESHHVDLRDIGETRFALARALWDSGREHSRARRFAARARQELEKTGSQPDLTVIERWLASHTS